MKNQELSKINAEIKSILNSINEYSELDLNNEFDTRDGYIVANIKVYDWLKDDDVLKVIENNQLENYKTEILEEFDDNRLSNIYNHVCETEVSYLKEKYEQNIDISNFKKIFSVYNFAKRFDTLEDVAKENKIDYYLENYFKIAKRFKTFKNFCNFIKRKNVNEYNEFLKRDSINFDCWQFGRSGGWFSICKVSELENDYLGDYIGCYAWELLNEDNNKDFNEKLNNYCLNYKESKIQFLSRAKANLKEIEAKFNNVKQIIIDIEESKKYFKDSLIHELEHEINEFIAEELKIQKPNVSIIIENDKVKTSLGVSVPTNEFKANLIEVLQELKANKDVENLPIKRNVGNYFVEYAQKIENDYLIKAGCHKFSLNNILNVFNISI